MPDTALSRRARFFSALVVTISAIVITVLAVINLARIITAHSGLEVPNTFAKPFGYLRYPARAKQDYYDQRDDQQLGHSKWTHGELLNRSLFDDVILVLACRECQT
jgi:hypothetical protein